MYFFIEISIHLVFTLTINIKFKSPFEVLPKALKSYFFANTTRQGISVVTQPVYLLAIFFLKSNLAQKLFESHTTVPRTIACRVARAQKNRQEAVFLTSYPTGIRTPINWTKTSRPTIRRSGKIAEAP